MFSEIAEIKSIREQKSKLSEREKELTEPILTDRYIGGSKRLFLKRRYLGQGMLPNERNSFLSSCFCILRVPLPEER